MLSFQNERYPCEVQATGQNGSNGWTGSGVYGNCCDFEPLAPPERKLGSMKERWGGKRVERTCLSFKPSNNTSSMIVSAGNLPPSLSWSRSLGS